MCKNIHVAVRHRYDYLKTGDRNPIGLTEWESSQIVKNDLMQE